MLKKFFENINYLSVYIIVSLIKFYQKTISFDHGALKIFYPGGFCRFRPTCSDYAIDAFTKYGIIKGTYKTCYRILRCNPWNKGGHDPV